MSSAPFKFLDSFTKDDREIFFGRKKEIEEIYSRIFQSNLLLVYGASGTGKTSLIQCGLSSKFNESDWLPLVVRRGGNILQSLYVSINNVAITQLKEVSSWQSAIGKGNAITNFKDSLQSLYLDHFKPIYLIFDQFEELFIFGSSEEINEFVKEISAVIKSNLQCKVIFVIRGEYLEHLTVFEEHIPNFFENRIRIEKMTRKNAEEAILGPCRVFNIEVEEGFAQQLLEKLGSGKSEVELTYLQVLLDKVWKMAGTQEGRKAGEIQFTVSLLEKAGRISDVLSDFLDEQIAKIPDSENALAVLKAFVSTEGTKRVIDVDEINELTRTLGKDLDKDAIENCVQQFVNLRILRDKDENNKYELRHDSLAAKIYEKITLAEKELLEVRQMLTNRHREYETRSTLLNDDDLRYIAPYEKKLFFRGAIADFIEKSRQILISSRRLKRRVAVMSLVSIILLVAAVAFYMYKQYKKSRSNELAAMALIKVNEDPTLAYLLAEEAYKLNPKGEMAVKALLNAYKEGPFFVKKPADYFVCSPDGKFIITSTKEDTSLHLYDIDGNELKKIKTKVFCMFNYKFGNFSNDGKRFLTTSIDSNIITLWDLELNVIATFSGKVAQFSPDGNNILISSKDDGIWMQKLINNNGKEWLSVGDSFLLRFIPDGSGLYAFNDISQKLTLYPFFKGKQVINLKKLMTLVKYNDVICQDFENICVFYIEEKQYQKRILFTVSNAKISTQFNGKEFFDIHSGKIIYKDKKNGYLSVSDMNGTEISRIDTKLDDIQFARFMPGGSNIFVSRSTKKLGIFFTEVIDSLGNIYAGFSRFTVNGDYFNIDSDFNNLIYENVDKRTVDIISPEGILIDSWKQNNFEEVSSDKKHFVFFDRYGVTIININSKLHKNFYEHKKVISPPDWSSMIKSSKSKISSDGKFLLTIPEIVSIYEKELIIKYEYFNPCIYELSNGSMKKLIYECKNQKGQPLFGFSPNNRFIYCIYENGELVLWKNNGERISTIFKTNPALLNNENVISFHPQNSVFAVVSDKNIAAIYDINSGKVIDSMTGHKNRVNSVQFSLNGNFIVTASDDSTAIIWKTNEKEGEWKKFNILKGHKGAVTSAVFSPDGKYILTASIDTTIRIWNLNGECVRTDILSELDWAFPDLGFGKRIKAKGAPASASFAKNSKFIIVKYKDFVIPLIDQCSERLAKLILETTFESFDVSPDGNYFVFESDGKISLHSTGAVKELVSIDGSDPQFSPDGKSILYSDNGTIKLFPATPEEVLRLVREEKVYGNIREFTEEEREEYGFK